MARQRMVRPDFFYSESLAQCSVTARLAFIGLWCISDDFGNQKYQPRRMQMSIFPYDAMTPDEFAHILDELEQVGCIKTYEVDGERYLNVPGFSIYQTVNRPSKSSIPAPSDAVENSVHNNALSEHSVSTHGALTLKKERKKESSRVLTDSTTTQVVTGTSDGVGGENPTPPTKAQRDMAEQQARLDQMQSESVPCPSYIAEAVKSHA